MNKLMPWIGMAWIGTIALTALVVVLAFAYAEAFPLHTSIPLSFVTGLICGTFIAWLHEIAHRLDS